MQLLWLTGMFRNWRTSLQRCPIIVVTLISCLATTTVMYAIGFRIPQHEDTNILNMKYKVLPRDSSCMLVRRLTESLRHKLSIINTTSPIRPEHFNKTCRGYNISNYDDRHTPLRTQIPASLEARVESLMFIDNMPIPREVFAAIEQMRAHIKGHYEVILVTAGSENHYFETQSLIRNLHNVVFPALKSFKFIYYDLGLTSKQREELTKHCRCSVISFPFSELPEEFSWMNCFAWKVFTIAAHFKQADVVIWADASIRFTNASALHTMIQKTKERGVQQRLAGTSSNRNALPSMFEAFGDTPCTHGNHIKSCCGCYGMYHNEPLIWHTVIVPWLRCASNARKCMCPHHFKTFQDCESNNGNLLGVCHRQDQSALNVILARLFREHYYQFVVQLSGWFQDVLRNENTDAYFPSLAKKAIEKQRSLVL